jgi:hypothetical protein
MSDAATTVSHPLSNNVTMLEEARSTSTTTKTDGLASKRWPGRMGTSMRLGWFPPPSSTILPAPPLPSAAFLLYHAEEGGLDTLDNPGKRPEPVTQRAPGAGASPSMFAEKLQAAQQTNNSFLCIGLDPDPELMAHPHLPSFFTDIIEETKDLVCAYKPNLAFFEALGLSGMQTMLESLRAIPKHIPIIADAKRGDIGNTARF